MGSFKEGDRVRSTLSGSEGTVTRLIRDRPPAGMPWYDSPGPWYQVRWDHGHSGHAQASGLEKSR